MALPSIYRIFASLQARLLLLVLLVSVPAVALFLLTAVEERRSAEVMIERDALRLVRQATAEQEQLIKAGRHLLMGLALGPDTLLRNPESCRTLLTSALEQFPQYFNITVIRPNGDTFCAGRPLVAANYGDRPFFQEVVRTKAFVVSDYVLGRATGRPNITLSYPMIDSTGELSGVLVLGFELTWMSALVSEAGLPPDSTFTIVDRQGTVLIRYPTDAEWIGKPAPPGYPVQIAHIQNTEGTLRGTGQDGIDRIYAYTHLGSGGSQASGLAAVGIPRSAAFAEADRQFTRNLGGLAAAALLMVIAAWIGGERLVLRGIRRLVQATQTLAAGDFSVRSGRSGFGSSEVTMLAQAFDQMADALAHYDVQRDWTEAQLRTIAERERVAREQAEAARRSVELAEARFRTFVESAPDAIVIVNTSGSIVLANGRAGELFGYDLDALIGQPMELLLPEWLRAGDAHYRDTFTEAPGIHPRRIDLDVIARRKDGSEIPVEVSVGSLQTDGEILTASVIRDVSERKAVERMKAQFVSMVSHELRTPLTPIIGIAGVLMRSDLTPQQKRLMETVERSGQSLLRIINDLLDFSKIDAGKITLEVIDLDLRDMVEEVVQLSGTRAAAKGLNLVWHVEDAVPSAVRGDPVRFKQILTNLVDNAVKFTTTGEVVIWGRLVEEIDDAVFVRFEVVDTGIGLGAEAISRLFTPFTQADASTMREFGGTGLGLAISARLVERMGGKIGVDSTHGQGSTFWFTVRLEKQPIRESGTPQSTGLTGVRALIVDDSAANRSIFKSIVSGWGMEGHIANDTIAALRQLRDAEREGRPVDVIILDFNLPTIDGIELARLINSDPALASKRLIMLASDHRVGLKQQAAAAGISAFLTKPIKRAQLLEALLSAVGSVPQPDLLESGELALTDMASSWAAPAKARRGRVLVAEDAPMNQIVILSMLDQLGYTADAVDDGMAALDALENHSYDAILMDGQMPRMDGLATTAEIRRREGGLTRVPIIAMTASAMSGDRERFLSAGMDDYLTKPITVADFEAALNQWIPDAVPTATPVPSSESRIAESASAPRLLNFAVLGELEQSQAKDGGSLAQEVITLYCEETPHEFDVLRQACRDRDAPALRATAHRLRGTSASIGADAMEAVARALETQAEGGDVSGIEALVQDLEVVYEQSKTALTTFLGRLQQTSVNTVHDVHESSM